MHVENGVGEGTFLMNTVLQLKHCSFVEETPRWLIQKGRDKEAERAVLAIKRWDGKIPDELRESVHSVVQSESEREVISAPRYIVLA